MIRPQIYMAEKFKMYTLNRPKTRKIVGWSLVFFGFVMLVTPLTPGGLLFFIGLEILGFRFVSIEKIKCYIKNRQPATVVQRVASRIDSI